MAIVFWDAVFRPFDVYEFFFLPQVKQCAIITYKHGIYDRLYQPQK